VTGRGELIAGRYGLLTQVGHGATGVVWQARDELLDRIVAVRQLPPLPDGSAEDSGHRERWVAAQPRHPNAVMVHDAVEQSGKYHLVMEHFPARSLAELVDATGPLTEEAVARIGAQISGALAAAHARGIAHRDITPANILVGSDGTAKITGFSVSHAHGDDTGFSSDMSSLGTTLHAALGSGQGRHEKPFTMRRRRSPLVDVLLWMRRRDPGDRPAMHTAHDALTAVLDGRPTGAPRPEPEPMTARGTFRPARRTRRPVRAAVVAIILLVAGAPAGIRILDSGGTAETADPRPHGQPVTSPRVPEPAPGTTASLVPMATATTSIATSPTTTHPPTTPETPVPSCVARYHVTTTWPGGYRAEITVVNKAGATAGWTVRWDLPAGHTITNLWDGHLTRRGSAVTVTNLDYNGRLPANGTTTFGLTADAPGSLYVLARTIPALTCESRPAGAG
jgi:serine/threonine protein kinase